QGIPARPKVRGSSWIVRKSPGRSATSRPPTNPARAGVGNPRPASRKLPAHPPQIKEPTSRLSSPERENQPSERLGWLSHTPRTIVEQVGTAIESPKAECPPQTGSVQWDYMRRAGKAPVKSYVCTALRI